MSGISFSAAFLLLLVAAAPPAGAKDWLPGIVDSCRTEWPDPARQTECIVVEAKALNRLVEARDNGLSGPQTDDMAACLRSHSTAAGYRFARALSCFELAGEHLAER